ncbi:helix-turn-helix domain-containing protein [Asanoa sp. NPDC049573]|uniref:TetR/AcrR family transcriptional regulator n=1 Tax=Asanoa sp. NPDC049573 TaxID=3155396 RepID=UPI00341E568D
MRADSRRAASTAATHQAIVDAARELLATRQWREFTLDAVAKRAGVTRVTVYNQVRSKQGLLDAVLADVAQHAGMDQLLTDTRDLTAADARRFVIERTCRFWHAQRDVLRPLFGLAAVDREVAATLARRERWRADQIHRLVLRLSATPPREAFDRSTVVAGVIALTSFPTYDGLGPLADDPARAAALIDHLVVSLTG